MRGFPGVIYMRGLQGWPDGGGETGEEGKKHEGER